MQRLFGSQRHWWASIAAVMLVSVILLTGMVFAARPDQSAHRTRTGYRSTHLGLAPLTTAATSTLTPTTWLPIITNSWCPPALSFTFVPPGFQNLQGRVTRVTPADYK
jgi:hypothetical protein